MSLVQATFGDSAGTDDPLSFDTAVSNSETSGVLRNILIAVAFLAAINGLVVWRFKRRSAQRG